MKILPLSNGFTILPSTLGLALLNSLIVYCVQKECWAQPENDRECSPRQGILL